jgi:exodeoxyribonuclease III
MHIVSFNLNGIRSAISKGFLEWLARESPDVVCLQELKAHPDQLDIALFVAAGYSHQYWAPAEKKGYSGVAILSKTEADAVTIGCAIAQHDCEGRVLRADFGELTVVSAYFPSGSSGEERLRYKNVFNADFQAYALRLKAERSSLVIGGDYNVAHTEIDIHSAKTNQKSAGFTLAEREWMNAHLADGFVDGFRALHPEARDRYTWWSMRAGARANNKGWRIDYTVVSENLRPALQSAGIHADAVFSDHAPIALVLG